MKYTVGSLFAGVGGICLGFKNARTSKSSFSLRWANEIDEYACETYRTNFKHQLYQGDIEKIIHPTRIDKNIEKLRADIKSTEENKDNILKEIIELQKKKENLNSKSNCNDDTIFNEENVSSIDEIESIKKKIKSLKSKEKYCIKKSLILEEKLTALLVERDTEFNQYLVDGTIPAWIDEQKKRDDFDKYILLRSEMIAEPIDVLNGGFPCQAFSIAGEQHGFKDPRGNLFLSIVDLIELLGQVHTVMDDKTGEVLISGKPRIIFLENVKNLKGHDSGRTYKAIKSRLEQCGYTIFEKVLNTMDFSDLPQNRERIYIIGFRDASDAQEFDLFNDEVLNKFRVTKTSEERAIDVRNVIEYDKTANELGKYYYTRKKYPNYFKQGKGINLDNEIIEYYQFYQVRRGMYVRKNQSDVCPTLTANMGTGGHNVPLIKVGDGVRKITPAEAFRLQGFPVGKGYKLPDNYNGREYSDSHLYKQAGNAVSVPVITLIAKEILKILEIKER